MAIPPKTMTQTIPPGEATLLWNIEDVSNKTFSMLIQIQNNTEGIWFGGANVAPNDGIYLGPWWAYGCNQPRQKFYGYPEGNNPIQITVIQEFIDY
jgi:hypothetical protein